MFSRKSKTDNKFKPDIKNNFYPFFALDSINKCIRINTYVKWEKKFVIYNFSDLLECKIFESESTKEGKDLSAGKAAVGAALFGAAGAVVGGMMGKKRKSFCNSLKVRFRFKNETGYKDIFLIENRTEKSSALYRERIKCAKQIQALSENIIRQYHPEILKETPEASALESTAEEIAKFKALLDQSAITQEEYDAKKKQLLERL